MDEHADVGRVGAKVGDLLEALRHGSRCQSGKPEDGQKHVGRILGVVALEDALLWQTWPVPSQGGFPPFFIAFAAQEAIVKRRGSRPPKLTQHLECSQEIPHLDSDLRQVFSAAIRHSSSAIRTDGPGSSLVRTWQFIRRSQVFPFPSSPICSAGGLDRSEQSMLASQAASSRMFQVDCSVFPQWEITACVRFHPILPSRGGMKMRQRTVSSQWQCT
jgi:hypothetical protein